DALRHRGGTCKTLQAARQGQSRIRRAVGRTLDHRRPPPSEVLRDRGTEPGHPRVTRSHQPAAIPQAEGSRASQFAALDKPALNRLPAEPFDLSQWSRARVNIDYHIAFDT